MSNKEDTFPVYKRGVAGVFGHATLRQLIQSGGALSDKPFTDAPAVQGADGGAPSGDGGVGANPPGDPPSSNPAPASPAGDANTGTDGGAAGDGAADPKLIKKKG